MLELDILIVEDNMAARMMLKELLADYVTEVRQLANGGHLATAIKQKPDLVITDLSMPHVDGFDVIRKVKEEYPSLPVYVVTGHADYTNDALHAGADEVFEKPLDADRLIGLVESLKKTSG